MIRPAVLQKTADRAESHGHLDPEGFRRHVEFRTVVPQGNPLVEHLWLIRWDREGEDPYYSQQVMHRPFVDLYVSAAESGIQCTFLGRRAYKAQGRGRIVGVRFRPGAFHAYWPGPMAELHEDTLEIERAFPRADSAFLQRLTTLDDESALETLNTLVREQPPQRTVPVDLIGKVIAVVESEPGLSVGEVAERFSKSERWIQQLFAESVGVGLKWLLQRQRLLEVARIIRSSPRVDGARLAYEHGYSSQQHFIADFKRVLGQTPLQYKRSLVALGSGEPGPDQGKAFF